MATNIEQIGTGLPEGSRFGWTSSERLAFWGATPTSQPAANTTQTAVTTTVSISSSVTTSWGYATSTQANDIVTQLNAAQTDIRAIRDALRTAGILN